MVKPNVNELMQAIEDGGLGFCLECGAEACGVEPDARNYTCEDCGAAQVFGAEELLMMGAYAGGMYEFSRYCGAYVCVNCDDHRGLFRCYCGWSASGADGRRELEDMGEVIDEE